MERIENATVVMKANIYENGKITSRTLFMPGGEKKTLGIMLPGNYEFKTADQENMEVLAGSMKVLLPNEAAWHVYKGGEGFIVPANSTFQLEIEEVADYCCTFEK